MAQSLQTPADVGSDFASLRFVVIQFLTRIHTATPVTVVACTNSGGLSPWGTVDVIPLVGMVTADGRVIPHKTVFKLPYLRIQGGKNAVIIDPEPGDIGVAVFCERDISAVKTDPQAAISNATGNKGTPPGSGRMYDMADGFYLGGGLNDQPEQFVRFHADGIFVESPQKVRIVAPTIELVGNVNQSNGDVDMTQNLTVHGNVQVDGTIHADGTISSDTDVRADGISGKSHDHGGVQSGGSNTGPPNP